MNGRRAVLHEQVGAHRIRDPVGIGLTEPCAEAAADDDRLQVEEVDDRGDARADRLPPKLGR